jgi:hypothetical protein
MKGLGEDGPVDQESLEQRHDHSNGEYGAHGPGRKPVPGHLDGGHHRGEKRGDSQERCAGQVVRAADVDAGGDDGDAKEEQRKSFEAVRDGGSHDDILTRRRPEVLTES